MHEQPQKTVKCVRCLKEYEAFAPTQAYNCACDVKGSAVYGAFGSTVLDPEVACFTAGEDHGLPNGQICDDCIKLLMKHGDLVEVPFDCFDVVFAQTPQGGPA